MTYFPHLKELSAQCIMTTPNFKATTFLTVMRFVFFQAGVINTAVYSLPIKPHAPAVTENGKKSVRGDKSHLMEKSVSSTTGLLYQ